MCMLSLVLQTKQQDCYSDKVYGELNVSGNAGTLTVQNEAADNTVCATDFKESGSCCDVDQLEGEVEAILKEKIASDSEEFTVSYETITEFSARVSSIDTQLSGLKAGDELPNGTVLTQDTLDTFNSLKELNNTGFIDEVQNGMSDSDKKLKCATTTAKHTKNAICVVCSGKGVAATGGDATKTSIDYIDVSQESANEVNEDCKDFLNGASINLAIQSLYNDLGDSPTPISEDTRRKVKMNIESVQCDSKNENGEQVDEDECKEAKNEVYEETQRPEKMKIKGDEETFGKPEEKVKEVDKNLDIDEDKVKEEKEKVKDKQEELKKNNEEGEGEKSSNGDKSGEDKPEGEKSTEDKPEGEKSTEDKPEGEKPEGEKSTEDKPEGEKPTGEKPEGEKPTGEKPTGEKPDRRLLVNNSFKNAQNRFLQENSSGFKYRISSNGVNIGGTDRSGIEFDEFDDFVGAESTFIIKAITFISLFTITFIP